MRFIIHLHQSYQRRYLTACHILPERRRLNILPSQAFQSPCSLAFLPDSPREKAPWTFLTLLCQTHLSCTSYSVSVLFDSQVWGLGNSPQEKPQNVDCAFHSHLEPYIKTCLHRSAFPDIKEGMSIFRPSNWLRAGIPAIPPFPHVHSCCPCSNSALCSGAQSLWIVCPWYAENLQ